jgi:hypothetical protein
MNAKNGIARVGRVAAVVAAVALVATACDREPTSPPPSHVATGAGVGTTPGQVTVKLADMNLRITDAVARLDASGNGELSMRIANGGGVPEHVDMIGLPDSARAGLTGGSVTDGPLTSAGVLIPAGGSVVFGSHGGPRATLRGVHGVTAQHTVPVIIEFGVAGLVRLQAKVTSG